MMQGCATHHEMRHIAPLEMHLVHEIKFAFVTYALRQSRTHFMIALQSFQDGVISIANGKFHCDRTVI